MSKSAAANPEIKRLKLSWSYFLQKIDHFEPSIHHNKTLQNSNDRQLALVKKMMKKLHENLQYDMNLELEKLYWN